MKLFSFNEESGSTRIENSFGTLLFVGDSDVLDKMQISATLRTSKGDQQLVLPKMSLRMLAEHSAMGIGANPVLNSFVTVDKDAGKMPSIGNGKAYYRVKLAPLGQIELTGGTYVEFDWENKRGTENVIEVSSLGSPLVSNRIFAYETEPIASAMRNKTYSVSNFDTLIFRQNAIEKLTLEFSNGKKVEMEKDELFLSQFILDDQRITHNGGADYPFSFSEENEYNILPLSMSGLNVEKITIDTEKAIELIFRRQYQIRK